jgi:hypothetical protein
MGPGGATRKRYRDARSETDVTTGGVFSRDRADGTGRKGNQQAVVA